MDYTQPSELAASMNAVLNRADIIGWYLVIGCWCQKRLNWSVERTMQSYTVQFFFSPPSFCFKCQKFCYVVSLWCLRTPKSEALSKLFQFSTPGAFMPSPRTKPGCATSSCAVPGARGSPEDVVSGRSVTWTAEIRKPSWTHLQSLQQDGGGCHWKWMLRFPAARARPVWQQRYLNISVEPFWKNPREMKVMKCAVRPFLILNWLLRCSLLR